MSWDQADSFREKLKRGQVCLGTVISFTDPTVTEALCRMLDFIWIDMEHNALGPWRTGCAVRRSRTSPLAR